MAYVRLYRVQENYCPVVNWYLQSYSGTYGTGALRRGYLSRNRVLIVRRSY